MKKIISLVLVCVLALTAIGGTLAYFTDTDAKDNVFTIGNVDIALREVFDEETAQLIPGKDIQKEVFVKNTGVNDAYVRVHIAIPTEMDDGDPNFNASKNFLHFNFTNPSVVDGQWSWLPNYAEGIGYKGNGEGNWNFYSTKIDNVDYNVYVVTYRTALTANTETSTPAMNKVYLDRTVDATVTKNDEGEVTEITYKDTKGNTVKMDPDEKFEIKVFAEGVQAEGFGNAYEAFAASYPAVGTYNPWTTK